jgi:hypothetical protein
MTSSATSVPVPTGTPQGPNFDGNFDHDFEMAKLEYLGESDVFVPKDDSKCQSKHTVDRFNPQRA